MPHVTPPLPPHSHFPHTSFPPTRQLPVLEKMKSCGTRVKSTYELGAVPLKSAKGRRQLCRTGVKCTLLSFTTGDLLPRPNIHWTSWIPPWVFVGLALCGQHVWEPVGELAAGLGWRINTSVRSKPPVKTEFIPPASNHGLEKSSRW